jgi:hypothetical protein
MDKYTEDFENSKRSGGDMHTRFDHPTIVPRHEKPDREFMTFEEAHADSTKAALRYYTEIPLRIGHAVSIIIRSIGNIAL